MLNERKEKNAAFWSKSTIFTAFTAKWAPCLQTLNPHFLKGKNQVNQKKQYFP